MKTKIPKISIVIITLNNERTIRHCLNAISKQSYPKSYIEYLNIDGGSTDNTVNICRSYGFRSVRSYITNNAEAQRAIGVKEAKHNLIVSIDADNYITNTNWLELMVQPFIENPNIVHAGTLHFGYRKNDTIFNRYCALFGVLDPVVYYVGKPDRMPRYRTNVTYGTLMQRTKTYEIVRCNENTLPTVGCNGVVYKRDLLLRYAQSAPDAFLHIDVFVDLIRKGYDVFAIVHTDVIHDTAITLPMLMKKRIAFLEGYFLTTLKNKPIRRYLIIDFKKPSDIINLILYTLYSLTCIKPIIDSVYGYLRIRDIAWFLHPFMCIVFLITYGIATGKKVLRTISSIYV